MGELPRERDLVEGQELVKDFDVLQESLSGLAV